MSIKGLLKDYIASLLSVAMYVDGIKEDEEPLCVVCEDEGVAIILRQIIHQGFTTIEDYRQLEKYYPYRRSS